MNRVAKSYLFIDTFYFSFNFFLLKNDIIIIEWVLSMNKTIKYLVILCLFFLPFFVEAKKNYLYDVMKDASDSDYVGEFTGEHEDSLTIPADSKIYHWVGQDTLIKTKNNVIFAGFCWQIVRTTDTGGVRLIYNGVPTSTGACTSSRPNHMGLAYGSVYLAYTSYYYSSSYRYDENEKVFYLTGDKKFEKYNGNSISEFKNFYTCKNTDENGRCTVLYYIDDSDGTGNAFAYSFDVNTHYSAIGISVFNSLKNSLSDMSYTYNKRYPIRTQYETTKTSMSSGSDVSYVIGDDFVVNANGRYDLVNPRVFKKSDWANNYQDYVNKYQCEFGSGLNQAYNCRIIEYISDFSDKYYMVRTSANLNYLYGDDFVYDSNTGKYTVSGNTALIKNYVLEADSYSGKHYTCFNESGVCDSINYVFNHLNTGYDDYITLSNGESVTDAYNNMISGDNNPKDSDIKKVIEKWYEENMIDYSRYIEDSIYCIDRTNTEKNGFNNDNVYGMPNFTREYNILSLSCSRVEDKYSVSNEKAKLKYPVALLSFADVELNINKVSMYENKNFWVMDPAFLTSCNGYTGTIYMALDKNWILGSCSSTVDTKAAVRPAITLVKGVKYDGGDGTQNNPYLIADFVSSNIIVENDENKGTVEIDSLENIEEGSKVSFSIQPKKGYGVDNVTIKDSEGNIIDYQSDNNEYSFVMPDSDTTIKIEYKKLKYEVSVQIVNETKDYSINITDLTQVEYEEEVIFKATPVKGFQIKEIKVLDVDNQEVEFTENDHEYKFIMPASDVIIIPIYERVKNPVVIEENIDTSFVTVEVANITAVVYEDKVLFQVDPTEGYVLAEILIKDADGNTIEYTRKDNGNVFEFIMPDREAIISLSYEKIVEEPKEEEPEKEQTQEEKNPNTQDIVLLVLIILLVSFIITKGLEKHLASS